MKLLTTIAFTLLASTAAFATPWSVPDGSGGWVDNPECHSSSCHETGVPDTPTTPEPPAPEQPTATPRTSERPDSSVAPQYGFCCVKDSVLYFNIIEGGNVKVARSECVDLQNKSRTAECSPQVNAIINKQ